MCLSPHDPMMSAYLGGMGVAHFAAERYDDAVEWTKRSVRAGRTSFNFGFLASSYAHLGRLDEARAAVEQLARHEPDYSIANAERSLGGAVPSLVERYLVGLRKAGLKEE